MRRRRALKWVNRIRALTGALEGDYLEPVEDGFLPADRQRGPDEPDTRPMEYHTSEQIPLSESKGQSKDESVSTPSDSNRLKLMGSRVLSYIYSWFRPVHSTESVSVIDPAKNNEDVIAATSSQPIIPNSQEVVQVNDSTGKKEIFIEASLAPDEKDSDKPDSNGQGHSSESTASDVTDSNEHVPESKEEVLASSLDKEVITESPSDLLTDYQADKGVVEASSTEGVHTSSSEDMLVDSREKVLTQSLFSQFSSGKQEQELRKVSDLFPISLIGPEGKNKYYKNTIPFITFICILIGISIWWISVPTILFEYTTAFKSANIGVLVRIVKDIVINKLCCEHLLPLPCANETCGGELNQSFLEILEPASFDPISITEKTISKKAIAFHIATLVIAMALSESVYLNVNDSTFY